MTRPRLWRTALIASGLALAACGGGEPRLGVRPVERAAALRDDALTVRVRDLGDARRSIVARVHGTGQVIAGPARAEHRGDGDLVRIRLTPEGRTRLTDCDVGSLDVELSEPGSDARRQGATAAVSDGGPPCGRFFGPQAPWNRAPAPDAPLDPASEAITADLRRQVAANYTARFGPDINTSDYSTRVYTAGPDQPRVAVALPPEKRFADAPFRDVPLPAGAQPAEGTDHHLVLWQPSTDTMWEFYGLQLRAGAWYADWGGRIENVSRSDGVFRPAAKGVRYGATASGLALAGGLITPGDLRRGRIDHALAFAIPRARAGAWSAPAQRTDGISPALDSVPQGARFRIDPDLDVAALGLPPLTRMMAEAAQRYGMILRDQSGVVTFYAQTVLGGPNAALARLKQDKLSSEVLRNFPWDHLELLEMDLRR